MTQPGDHRKPAYEIGEIMGRIAKDEWRFVIHRRRGGRAIAKARTRAQAERIVEALEAQVQ